MGVPSASTALSQTFGERTQHLSPATISKNLVFPPFGFVEVLAMDTSDPAIAKGADFCDDSVYKSITDSEESPF